LCQLFHVFAPVRPQPVPHQHHRPAEVAQHILKEFAPYCPELNPVSSGPPFILRRIY
jgi:hypothetical protein